MISHDPARRVRCTGEFILAGKTKGVEGENKERVGQEPVGVEVPRPEGVWWHTHTVGDMARLIDEDGSTRGWPVAQLISL